LSSPSVLVVDDNPVNLTLARLLLTGEGYHVRTSPDAEQALEELKTFRPDLILVDVQLPGMDGLELTRTLRRSPGLGSPLIVALTASAMEGDEARAIAAGCDGYVHKPIEPRSFRATIQQYFQRTKEPAANHESLEELARAFLSTGAERSQALLHSIARTGPTEELRTALHQWAGLGGTFGYPEITRIARDIETALEQGATAQSVRTLLSELASVFSAAARHELEHPTLPAGVAEILTGKRVALIGFNELGAARITVLLDEARAFWRRTESAEGRLEGYDLAILNLAGAGSAAIQWDVPTLAIGPRAILMDSRRPRGECRAHDFLVEPWDAMEAVLRASMLLREAPAPETAPAKRRVVVIADDDPTTIALVRATLQNYGFDCIAASDGGHALELMRTLQPLGVILDVNMPNLDGFEVLAAARQDPKTSAIRVILLTARRQESDVLRGFALGADDYVAKPFSPMELTARLKRLLA
jgi:two-component system, cell cycle response regulator DivK